MTSPTFKKGGADYLYCMYYTVLGWNDDVIVRQKPDIMPSGQSQGRRSTCMRWYVPQVPIHSL